MVYLDYNATTPLEPEVLDAIHHALAEAWGNPSSSYEEGQKAKTIIAQARSHLAKMIGANPSDIVFTSGGTEGNNMILQTGLRYYENWRKSLTEAGDGDNMNHLPHFITSNMEHDSIKHVLEHFQETGQAEVTFIPASTKTGRVSVESVVEAIKPNTCMITIMSANNETGVIQPLDKISANVRLMKRGPRESKILMHTDAAQTLGKIPVDVFDLDVDYLTIVGHKFYGPRIGAVYVRDLGSGTLPLYPIFFGGGQERNFRSGTENTGMIAGLGKAAEIVCHNCRSHEIAMRNVRAYLEEKLKVTFGDSVVFNGKLEGSERIPNTCNVSFLGEGLEGYKILAKCQVLQASIGAACHAQNRPSPILLAIGVPVHIARNALRLSVGRYTTMSDIDRVVADLKQAVEHLQSP
ncbi:hypothetical protein CHS0354_016192 [Potamilus streckersoni]|uniref:Selenocysteine lyase n=1 Tax=Potamilus streckersoni TaxID=2493646 RepID=A0AAE0RXF9_9BIVA|nr:hypothetical protein CHS0354_016192 [Potamilus streckersoni]